ncbi:MAG: hypothetical protein RL477_288 [Pseudomonadota bacterium]|jgi:indolepyruvate ferredoxin oxidoreductase
MPAAGPRQPGAIAPNARLADRYDAAQTRVFVTGTQALVRALLARAWLDARAGWRTGGFVSGYRGSPLGGFDRDLDGASKELAAAGVRFTPGVNEELAATAIWGSQQLGLFPGARVEGVFGLWYGKGPGVDRSGDAFKHANLAGTSPRGGVLAVAGDDHAGVSSTTTHQSEYAFVDAQIPVLAPSCVQEIFDLAVTGIEMSRASGLWVALKCPSDVVEQAATIEVAPERFRFPAGRPRDDLHIRWPDRVTDSEARLAGPKLAAAREFVRTAKLDRALGKNAASRTGIVAAGKSWADVEEALDLLGLDEAACARAGIALYKPAMVWPLEPDGLRAFTAGLERLIVVEEKRPLLEQQAREILYDAPADARPEIIGKETAGESRLAVPLTGVLTPAGIARALAPLLGIDAASLAGRGLAPSALPRATLRRPPHFCAGCPHNASTRVPEGSWALSGIGCHTLSLWSEPHTKTLTQMGGEGASWIGQAPFTETSHIFANIGDGTYYHSGLLAIRAAVSAGVNITYKLLYNDAVAMTGGQKVEGNLSVPAICRELAAEGVARIVVVAEDPEHYSADDPFPAGVAVTGRDGFDCAQAELARVPGVSVLVYDQACAAEKRRRRRRGELDDPARWVFINERVCEGCGDCQRASHCLSVVPVATPFGEKRRIDLAGCNKDETCLEGFCPAMVVVEGGRPRRHAATTPAEVPAHLRALPDPALPDMARPWRILAAGIGGTGVVTIGHLIAQAAHLEGRAAALLDQTGLAQKGGSVASHVTLAARDGDIAAVRIGEERADAVIGCDLVVAADTPQISAIAPSRTRVVVNTEETITGAFLRDAGLAFPAGSLTAALAARAGAGNLMPVDARRLAERLTGAAIAANVLLLGYAWQKGLVPVSERSLLAAIDLNGAGAAANREAFVWGRRAAEDMAAVSALAGIDGEGRSKAPPTLAEVVNLRARELAAYGGGEIAQRYRDAVAAIAELSSERTPARGDALVRAVAQGYFHVLAAKDEYEVARLYTDGTFAAEIVRAFEGDARVQYHFAPAWLARRDASGRPAKRRFGPWIGPLLALIARLRRLRGGPLDLFRGSADRALERRHRTEYESDLGRIRAALSEASFDTCRELAELALAVRGFGHVRREAYDRAAARRSQLRDTLGAPGPGRRAAE